MAATTASPELGESPPTSHFPRKIFEGHSEWVMAVSYFRDGKHIVSGSNDKTVRLWNVESGMQEGKSLEHDFEVRSIAISPDERTLAVGTVGGGRVVLWDLESRSVIWTKQGREGGSCRVSFSPDGKLIAATAGDSENIDLLDPETGEMMREPLQCSGRIFCLAFSPDGTQLAAGLWNGTAQVFNVATGETSVDFTAHSKRITSLVFTRDGRQIISTSYDKSIRVWDCTTAPEIGPPIFGHGGYILQIALSSDGQHLASAALDGTVRVWDVNAQRQLSNPLQLDVQHKLSLYTIAWSPDGKSVVAGDIKGNISLWDVPPFEDSNIITSTSRPRTSSLSSSLLDTPAGVPIQQRSNRPPRRDDFWDSSDLDLPAHAHTQISAIPIAEVPLKSSVPKAKTAPRVPSTSPPSRDNILGRIGARFRRDKHVSKTIEMRPPPPKIPKYSPVGKVALGQADARLYVDESKNKKQRDDESGQEEWADVEVNCWDLFCAMITSCCPPCKASQGDDS